MRDQGRGRAWSAGTDQCQQPHSSTWTVCVCRRRWRHHLKQSATVRLQLFTLALTDVVGGCMPGHGGGAVRQQLHGRALGAWGGGGGEEGQPGCQCGQAGDRWHPSDTCNGSPGEQDASCDNRNPPDTANGVLFGPPAVTAFGASVRAASHPVCAALYPVFHPLAPSSPDSRKPCGSPTATATSWLVAPPLLSSSSSAAAWPAVAAGG